MIKCCSGFEFQISVTNAEFKSYDMDYYGPEDLIKIIKYYYKQGVLKEDLNALNEMLLEDQIDTDNIAELQRRKFKLLHNDNLSNSIKNMIKVKGFLAGLDSVMTIAGRHGKTEIVLVLTISRTSVDRLAKTYIYITEDIFDLDSFEHIDKELGIGDRKISTDDLIKLRALRVVYDVIKKISTTDGAFEVEYMHVRTRQDGSCDYD